jgi:hypothetical protein
MRLLLIFCSLVLVGCTEPSILRGSGELATPPAGWLEHCTEQPRPIECGK